MFRFLRRSIFAGFLVLSLTFNAALIVSETAYNLAYSLVSNIVSVFYDGAELTSSVGWKKTQLSKNLDELDRKLILSENTLKEQSNDLRKLTVEKQSLERKQTKIMEEVSRKRQEIEKLDSRNKVQRALISKKNVELDDLSRKLTNVTESLRAADGKITNLKMLNKTLISEHDVAKKNLLLIKKDLSDTKIRNSQLTKKVTQSADEIAELTTRTAAQVTDIQSTKKIIRETTDRASKRIAKRVGRNIAAMPFESVPVAGIAITVGTIYLEIQDACTSLNEFNKMTASLGLDGDSANNEEAFCSLTRDDLTRLITNRSDDFEECIFQNDFENQSNIEEMMDCLPDEIEKLSIPEFDEFEMPAPAEL